MVVCTGMVILCVADTLQAHRDALNATRVQLGYHPSRRNERRLGAYWLLVGFTTLSGNRALLIGFPGTLPLALQCG